MIDESRSATATFTASEREAVYKTIFACRDVRRFISTPIPGEAVERILLAAHHAPSVGFMQPRNFIVIRDPHTKTSIKQAFLSARSQEAERFSDNRKKLYLSLKLEGIEEAPLNICVTCDSTRHGRAVLGRTLMPQTDIYSTCCAIQNLWLAARAEGLGVGWVSILSEEKYLAHSRSHRRGRLLVRGLSGTLRIQTSTRNCRLTRPPAPPGCSLR